MNQSFVPKAKGPNATDDRELGLMVYHLYVGEADALGTVDGVVDAGPVTLAGTATGRRARDEAGIAGRQDQDEVALSTRSPLLLREERRSAQLLPLISRSRRSNSRSSRRFPTRRTLTASHV